MVLTSPALTDPPPDWPCTIIIEDPVFCIRVTDIVKSPGLDNRFKIELMFVNWTGIDVAGIVLSLNTGPNPGEGVPEGEPFFCSTVTDPTCDGPSIDANGRPIGPGAELPLGNMNTMNDWTVVDSTQTRICFAGGTPIPHASALGFQGLADPDFVDATNEECGNAMVKMVPGSMLVLPSFRFRIPDPETIDDGSNVADGFVIEIDDWDAGEQLSFNWHLLDADGNVIGFVSMSGPTFGDQFGFGTFNLTRFSDSGAPGENESPDPLFDLNSGYNPVSDEDSNADTPLLWAEDEVNGIDMHPVNPIPVGRPGQGTWFGVEPGAAVTAEFANGQDNQFMFLNSPVFSGTNITVSAGCPCDWDGDQLLNSTDFFAFLSDFLGNGDADFNGDGITNSTDFFAFLSCFLAPPPEC